MPAQSYSQRLGLISDEQFQAALARFQLGTFIKAEPITSGLFGQNVFVISNQGAYVLRGNPHIWWQFPTERYYVQQLHEHTRVPVPWPYLIDSTTDIFGWSYVIMPRMSGLHLADPAVQAQLSQPDRHGIAQALAENLVAMHSLTWPFPGRYSAATNSVEPLDMATELAWPFPIDSPASQSVDFPFYQYVIGRIRSCLARAQQYDTATTDADIAWVEDLIAQAIPALSEPLQPSLVMEDYKEDNVVVTQDQHGWHVSGLFDLMTIYFGDGEIDLSRPIAWYLERDPQLARTFLQTYLHSRPPRPGFTQRFPIYMLLDRAILWQYAHMNRERWWDLSLSFRDWAGFYISLERLL